MLHYWRTTANTMATQTDFELWQIILWAGTDDLGRPLEDNHSVHDVDPEALERLNGEYYQWRDLADEVLIKHGRGDTCLEDLWPTRVEHCYVLVRDGHGVSFTDDWISGSVSHKIATELDRLARCQGEINAYTDGTGRAIYAF